MRTGTDDHVTLTLGRGAGILSPWTDLGLASVKANGGGGQARAQVGHSKTLFTARRVHLRFILVASRGARLPTPSRHHSI
ncbi:hypothetical protein PDE_02072 [Penicillium oxalicum 114-2]|uniref:Uncharacterized protein n=1 Tax=Penicillium oxalicum (strain 114-2 / CGMCC 5302) TaxID=933388 RepID=S7Z937_PENO1|nr:hypothetical protein PDE_02072 [Penicillium oxalicum 114-2]